MFKRFIASAVIFSAGFAICAVINGSDLVSFAQALSRPATQAAQNPCQPQLWEYRVVFKGRPDRNLDSELNQLANQGFEVFSVKQTGEGSTPGFNLTIVLRRPKQ
jgi:hypothetical protein